MPQTIGGANGPFVNVSNTSGQWTATITWTDTAGISGYGYVAYGTDPNNASTTLTENNQGSQHSLVLNGLVAGTTYYYTASTLDSNGTTLAQSVTSSFTAAPPQVVGTPQAATSGPTAANISWQANLAGLGKVALGTAAANLSTIFTDNVNAFSHSVAVTGLQAGTQYFYQVSDMDGQGNVLAQSAVASFNTPPANVQVNLVQPNANPWVTAENHPSTLSVKAVLANGTPQPGITVNFKILCHIGGNGQIISAGAPAGNTGTAVTDATGTAQVHFSGKSKEIASVEATSPNSNSHALIVVTIL
jgi:hypothetical protein